MHGRATVIQKFEVDLKSNVSIYRPSLWPEDFKLYVLLFPSFFAVGKLCGLVDMFPTENQCPKVHLISQWKL